jgi:hypothetical protein
MPDMRVGYLVSQNTGTHVCLFTESLCRGEANSLSVEVDLGGIHEKIGFLKTQRKRGFGASVLQ